MGLGFVMLEGMVYTISDFSFFMTFYDFLWLWFTIFYDFLRVKIFDQNNFNVFF